MELLAAPLLQRSSRQKFPSSRGLLKRATNEAHKHGSKRLVAPLLLTYNRIIRYIKLMSSLSTALELGALDINPAFRETIFAHLRERERLRQGKMTSTTSTATPMRHPFDARVADVKSPKSDINALILDYLTMEGYSKAAAKFCKEANLQPQQENSNIQARQQIQRAIHSGRIEDSISALNDLDPEILDEDPQLHFALLRLQLVELIRESEGGDITPALDFATNKLAPRASIDPKFLKDLEQTMALLFFPHDDKLQPELAALLHSDLRRKVATEVNQAVLVRQTQRRDAAIRHLVRMRQWAETSARSKKKLLPDRLDIGLNAEGEGLNEDIWHGTGHEPMITT